CQGHLLGFVFLKHFPKILIIPATDAQAATSVIPKVVALHRDIRRQMARRYLNTISVVVQELHSCNRHIGNTRIGANMIGLDVYTSLRPCPSAVAPGAASHGYPRGIDDCAAVTKGIKDLQIDKLKIGREMRRVSLA